MRFCSGGLSALSRKRTSRSGMQNTWRMPSAIVPTCAAGRSPSSRSSHHPRFARLEHLFGDLAGRRDLAAVSNDWPDSVILPRARASLNSSRPSASAIMMKPRSAALSSMAESMTSASTSSSTRDEPSARKPFEQRRHLPQFAAGRRY